jgi:hypothetical protein
MSFLGTKTCGFPAKREIEFIGENNAAGKSYGGKYSFQEGLFFL